MKPTNWSRVFLAFSLVTFLLAIGISIVGSSIAELYMLGIIFYMGSRVLYFNALKNHTLNLLEQMNSQNSELLYLNQVLSGQLIRSENNNDQMVESFNNFLKEPEIEEAYKVYQQRMDKEWNEMFENSLFTET